MSMNGTAKCQYCKSNIASFDAMVKHITGKKKEIRQKSNKKIVVEDVKHYCTLCIDSGGHRKAQISLNRDNFKQRGRDQSKAEAAFEIARKCHATLKP